MEKFQKVVALNYVKKREGSIQAQTLQDELISEVLKF